MGRKATDKNRYKNEQAREKLVIKSMVYFQNNGTTNTMSKMANDLSISKTTIYNHFKTKEELVQVAIEFKLDIIRDYQSVLHNTGLPYIERYRKAMLFYCVQAYEVSALFLQDIERDFPNTWQYIEKFRQQVFNDLTAYYALGIEKGILKETIPALHTFSDQAFFRFLASDYLTQHNITVVDAFKQHFQTKFMGLVYPDKINSF